MRKSSYIILALNIFSVLIGLYLLRNSNYLMTSYVIDNPSYIKLSKGNIILIGLIPFVVVFTMDFLATIEAKEVKGFIKVYDQIKYMLCFSFQLLYILIIVSQLYKFNEKYIVGFTLATTLAFISFKLVQIPQNHVIGFKNKWTLSDEQVWNKVHIQARRLGYMLSLAIIVITLSKARMIAPFTLALIAVIFIYIYYYSHKVYKQYK